ncbi:MAG: DUF3015 domain-containing protein [Elusimicrobiota bacterium]|nr:MAG: DUF3015 domain-containing protein [Elusimicrobiota bacterium]
MMKRTLWTLAAALVLSTAAQASGQNDAGCGLGSMLFKEQKPVHQVLAATTNGSLGNQTFGITTGTLGCTSGGLIKSSKEREVFVATNFRAIERELAAGKGQYASSLASLSGCGAKSDEFLAVSKAKYEKLFPSAKTGAAELLKNLDKEIAADASLSKACVL